MLILGVLLVNIQISGRLKGLPNEGLCEEQINNNDNKMVSYFLALTTLMYLLLSYNLLTFYSYGIYFIIDFV